MLVQSFPKPKVHKHHARNNPKPIIDSVCMFCGSIYAQTHECFGGKNRQLSIKYKLQVKLCDTCHRNITDEKWPSKVQEIKQIGQMKFEETHSREEFMKVFGRNYL